MNCVPCGSHARCGGRGRQVKANATTGVGTRPVGAGMRRPRGRGHLLHHVPHKGRSAAYRADVVNHGCRLKIAPTAVTARKRRDMAQHELYPVQAATRPLSRRSTQDRALCTFSARICRNRHTKRDQCASGNSTSRNVPLQKGQCHNSYRLRHPQASNHPWSSGRRASCCQREMTA